MIFLVIELIGIVQRPRLPSFPYYTLSLSLSLAEYSPSDELTIMKTRRKSKATNLESDADGDDSFSNPFASFDVPDDVDLESLTNIVPEDINLTSPTPESIVSLYRYLLAQVEEIDASQRELEEARAEGERKDIELDQALQDRESQSHEYEASLDTLQSELKEVKQERDQLGASGTPLFSPFVPLTCSSFFTSCITGSNYITLHFSVFFVNGS